MSLLNETHDPTLESWISAANVENNGFPIQNLPYGVFRPLHDPGGWRPGVRIGDQVLDLASLADAHTFPGKAAQALAACRRHNLNALMHLGHEYWSALRLSLSRALRKDSPDQAALSPHLHPIAQIEMGLPAQIGDYTDFYISEHHATAVGRQFRPDNPLLPNYKWVPIGYHGRASSIGVSGQQFLRPVGQTRPTAEGQAPAVGPCARLDFELELGIFVGHGNEPGERLNIGDAESRAFGLCLLNDWSARDIQAWEYQPLGPFLAKNFATTISPWIVTLEALAPFRRPFQRAPEDPQPLAYLQHAHDAPDPVFDIELEAWLSTSQSRIQDAAPVKICQSNFRDAYWTVAQLLTHHTINGCNLQPGDLLGTGTLSGPDAGQEGSLLEVTQGGKTPLELPWGEQRSFLEDGDEISLRARCHRDGYPIISLGECTGRVLPARWEN